MKFLQFIKQVQIPDFFLTYKTLCFRGAKNFYPLLFFSLFFKQLKDVGVPIESINVFGQDVVDVMAQLSTSFLGATSLYWLKNISELKGKKSKLLLEFLKNYTGPNSVIFFIDETVVCSSKDFDIVVDLPDKVDQTIFLELASAIGTSFSIEQKKQIVHLLKQTGSVEIDTACLLMRYIVLAGRGITDFARNWLEKLVESQHSLIHLSKHFFERDTWSFFVLWKQMEKEYSPQFWIAFWSEQLWRACNVVQLLKKQQVAQARQVSFRLPYSFTQGGWRTADVSRLRSAHDFLYSVDHSLKNGGDPFSLELFFTTYFE